MDLNNLDLDKIKKQIIKQREEKEEIKRQEGRNIINTDRLKAVNNEISKISKVREDEEVKKDINEYIESKGYETRTIEEIQQDKANENLREIYTEPIKDDSTIDKISENILSELEIAIAEEDSMENPPRPEPIFKDQINSYAEIEDISILSNDFDNIENEIVNLNGERSNNIEVKPIEEHVEVQPITEIKEESHNISESKENTTREEDIYTKEIKDTNLVTDKINDFDPSNIIEEKKDEEIRNEYSKLNNNRDNIYDSSNPLSMYNDNIEEEIPTIEFEEKPEEIVEKIPEIKIETEISEPPKVEKLDFEPVETYENEIPELLVNELFEEEEKLNQLSEKLTEMLNKKSLSEEDINIMKDTIEKASNNEIENPLESLRLIKEIVESKEEQDLLEIGNSIEEMMKLDNNPVQNELNSIASLIKSRKKKDNFDELEEYLKTNIDISKNTIATTIEKSKLDENAINKIKELGYCIYNLDSTESVITLDGIYTDTFNNREDVKAFIQRFKSEVISFLDTGKCNQVSLLNEKNLPIFTDKELKSILDDIGLDVEFIFDGELKIYLKIVG